MKKKTRSVLIILSILCFVFFAKIAYEKYDIYSRNQKIQDLQLEAMQLEARSDYISALEAYKEINALREGRKYLRDPNPHMTYQTEKNATAKMLIDYIQVLDTQLIDNGANATIVMKLKNNYNKTIKGEVDIYLRDESDKIVRTWLGMLPNDGILPGQTTTIKTYINKQNFKKIDIDGGNLREGL